MPETRIEHLVRQWKELRDHGMAVSSEELCRDCPELIPALRHWLDAHGESVPAAPAGSARSHDSRPAVRRDVIIFNPTEQAEAERCDTLRRRLRLVTFIFLISWPPLIGTVILLGERLEGVGILLQELVVVSMSSVVLTRRRTWSHAQLRWLEIAIFASVVFGIAYPQGVFYADGRLAHMLESGDDEKLVMLANTLAFSWFVVIVLYGVIIPNPWQRCAAIAGGMAVLPVALLGVCCHLQGILGHPLIYACLIKLAANMSFAFAIAVASSFGMDQLRRQVVEARKLGQYVLKRCLGKGGMGEVYLAEHQMLRRACAVKLIRSDKTASGRDQQRFEREVQVLANLSHWNIVEVFDYGVEADGTFYYVMEYLPGLTLHDMVERFGPQPPSRVIHFLRQIAAALGAAHASGVIHRDIKPANVMVCEKGGVRDFVKLLDFGLVQISLGKDDPRLTQAGGMVGTPAFMSPEQIAAAATLDARSDIYSVGVLAYYLLTGRNPFDRPEARQMFAAHLQDTAPPLTQAAAGIDADLEEVVRRCLAKDPADRFADADALATALAACHGATGWTSAEANAWWRDHTTALS